MNVQKVTKQTAQKAAQAVAQQTMETVKVAGAQVAPELGPQPQSQEPQEVQATTAIDPQEEARIKSQSAQRLAQLEGEMAELRKEREKVKQQEIESQQQAQLVKPELEKQTKSKGRMSGFFKRLSGKREMQKNVSG
jgi:hypothetical protein